MRVPMVVVWLASVLSSATDAIIDSTTLDDFTNEQLKDMIRQLQDAERFPATCLDSNQYHDCHRVVEANLCSVADFYARYCCRSCIRAGQVPPIGKHVQGHGDAPLTVQVNASNPSMTESNPSVSTRGVVTLKMVIGQDGMMTCTAIGYPAPEIVWFTHANKLISDGSKYRISVTHGDSPLLQTVHSAMILANFTPEDRGLYKCLAINANHFRSEMVLLKDAGKLQVEMLTKPQYVRVGSEVTLECMASSHEPPTITWNLTLGEAEIAPPERLDSVTTDDGGLTKVVSRLHWTTLKDWKNGRLKCRATNSEGQKEVYAQIVSISRWGERHNDWNDVCYDCPPVNTVVYIGDLTVPDNCGDTDSVDCYGNLDGCYDDPRLQRLCCRTCLVFSYDFDVESVSGRTTEVSGYAKATIEVEGRTGDEVGRYGHSAFMRCVAVAYPDPTAITWIKDGTPVQDSTKYRITETTKRHRVYGDIKLYNRLQMVLEVRHVNLSDIGLYTCRTTSGLVVAEDTWLMWLRKDDDDSGFGNFTLTKWRGTAPCPPCVPEECHKDNEYWEDECYYLHDRRDNMIVKDHCGCCDICGMPHTRLCNQETPCAPGMYCLFDSFHPARGTCQRSDIIDY